MTLHVFNPEHDIALAANLSNFTAPHAGRQLRHDLGFLPMLWAGDEDVVLVDDLSTLPRIWERRCRCRMVEKRELAGLEIDAIEPWGWDLALRSFLLRYGVSEELMPNEAAIDDIRQLSHRRIAMDLLSQLRVDGTEGEAYECTTSNEVATLLDKFGKVVLKAPWSSSGRGIRFLDGMLHVHERWLTNLLERQGSVMLEPCYNKVKDFGMEFRSDGKGGVEYLGLSLFHTANGAYTGNILATERAKEAALAVYIDPALTDALRQRICQVLGERFLNRYVGPFGIDMMVVARPDAQGFLLHPCVEINLRRTMGHVALEWERQLNPQGDDDLKRVMRITYNENYYKLTNKRL